MSIGQAQEGLLYNSSEVETFSVSGWPKFGHTKDEHCIAITLYHESRGETLRGQRSVYDVIENRIREEGQSACKVVKRHKQFSFVTKKTKWKATDKQLEMLDKVRNHQRVLANNYLWYYNRSMVNPIWAINMKCRKIAKHSFCKKIK